MEKLNHWVEDWLFNTAEAEGTRKNYKRFINHLNKFCQQRGKNLFEIVEEYRTSRRSGYQAEMDFTESWQDLIRTYSTHIKRSDYTPLTRKSYLTGVKSFLSYYKIPIDVDLPKRVYVKYHNRDLTKEHIKKILAKASQRDRTIFLLMAESGLRANTTINIEYWQIKEDYENGTVPLKILTPASTLKDHVGDRWSFIGEDGVKTLREYLQPRMPLKDKAFIFTSRKPEKMKGKQFTTASISTIFRHIVNALKLENSTQFMYGKPHHLRLHGLRKYFRNNMRGDASFREFWMGHNIDVDSHYISTDPEFHRKEYKKHYEELRILEPATPAQLTEITENLKQKDQEIQQLREKINDITETMKFQEKINQEILEELLTTGKDREKKSNKIILIKHIMKLLEDDPSKLKEEIQKMKKEEKE